MPKLIEKNALKLRRVSLGLTQAELAKKAEVSQPCVSSLERTGKATWHNLSKIVHALGGRVLVDFE